MKNLGKQNEQKSWNGPTATVFTGIAMVAASVLIAVVWPHVGALSIVGLVWGSLLICAGLCFSQRAVRLEKDHAFRFAQLEERRIETELKRDLLESVFQNGLPDGVSREWVEKMLSWNSADIVGEEERRAA